MIISKKELKNENKLLRNGTYRKELCFEGFLECTVRKELFIDKVWNFLKDGTLKF